MASKKGFAFIIALIVTVLAATPAMACVGARPLGMGGAFIAVADDANVTYWNPAALAFREGSELTGMVTSDLNYRWYWAWTQPNWGVSMLKTQMAFYDDPSKAYIDLDTNTWLWTSYGFMVTDKLALGANFRFMSVEREVYGPSTPGSSYSYFGPSWAGDFGVDVSMLYRINDQWSFGILVQNLIPETLEFYPADYTSSNPAGSFSYYYVTNVRPGIAYRPTPDTTIAFDIYGLNLDPKPCFGVEQRINENLTVRAGYYQDTPTFGATLDVGETLSLEYAYMYGSPIASAKFRF